MAPFARYAAFATIGNTNTSHRLISQGHQREICRGGTGGLPVHFRVPIDTHSSQLFMENDRASPLENSSFPIEEEPELDKSFSIPAVLILNFVAIIWGSQHSVVKMVVGDEGNAASFSFARFALATIIASPFTPNIGSFLTQFSDGESTNINIDSDEQEQNEQNALAWRWGIEMGLWMFLGYAFQAIGLEYTTAQRSGFLLYLNVKFVPFFANVLFGRKISISTWASAFTALAGTALIVYDGTSRALNVGDLWSVAAAAASAMFILRLESATNAVKNSAALNAASLWMVTFTAFIWCIVDGMRGEAAGQGINAIQATVTNVFDIVSLHPFELIYLGAITTALANYLQTKAQKEISAERASIIYALDPVYGEKFKIFCSCNFCNISTMNYCV